MPDLNRQPIRKRMEAATRVLLVAFGLCAGAASAQDADETPLVSQSPLSVGGSVPSNVLLTPSVEFPTINSKANLGGFSTATAYNGYFDSYKCYKYRYSATESERHFYPVGTRLANPATCSSASKEWSGNYLNWAATQTIDPFRKALTGGLRVVDTASETWLEKARQDGQGGLGTYFPLVNITSEVSSVSPAPWSNLRTRVENAGNRLLFTSTHAMTGEDLPTTIIAYNPDANPEQLTAANAGTVFSVVVRVKVCDNDTGLEPNCVAYGSNYKPEGLIQKYQRKMRFSVFGYLLDNGMYRDGGVLRANQKFVGPEFLDPTDGIWKDNPLKEWDPDTGVFYVNPNSAEALATSTAIGDADYPITNSGVINYINKFGQLTGTNAKNYDPVSELYYTATRYLRKLDPISTYNDLTVRYNTTGGTAVAAGVGRWNLTDGFPVVTNWDDPYQYWCQNTAIIGIGDVYTHRDKNLTGRESGTDEPAMPGDVTNDPSFSGDGNYSIPWWSRKAYEIEGIDYNATFQNQNSPYIVGLAYYIHTQDLRPGLGETDVIRRKRQTASTHWVDVRESQRVEPRERNQYWMATKYGGFLVPTKDEDKDGVPDFDSTTYSTAFPLSWWDSGETLTSNSSNSGAWPNDNPYRRNNNFYVADKPDTMISGLSRAFAKFGSESKGSGASLAANSTRLDTTTLTFQAQFQNSIWLGQLNAYKVDPATGALAADPLWTAGSRLKATTWDARNIKVNAGGDLEDFEWGNLTNDQKNAFNDLWAPDLGLDGEDGQHVVDYIRGNQALEEGSSGGVFRTRTAPEESWSPMLGDIVNSTPVFVGAPNAALYATSPGTWNGKTDHDDFATAQANRTPVVWVGGNDGMLHAFDASVTEAGNATGTSGNEVFAFVPSTAITSGLADYANPNYTHKYFVDGDIAVADVYINSAWKTVLVGTMGRGGPGIFALDVTNPNSPTFLWEKSVANISSLGHNIGRPVIAQVANGDWRVILGNGPDSDGGSATLITIELDDGTVTTHQLDSGSANGLSAVLARDSNADGISDVIYAGDLEGNLWKVTSFTGNNNTASSLALFTAQDPDGDAQPITAAPLVGRDPATLITWVFFGTGKFLNEDDLISTQTQTWYGIKDEGTAVSRGDLVARTIDATGAITEDHDNNPATPEEVIFQVRTVSPAADGDMDDAGGWRMDLPESKERIVVPNRFQGSALIGTTRIPDASDACAPSGGGFIMAINPFTGGRLPQTFFDANRDGVFNAGDTLNGTIVSGIGIDSSPNNPIFIDNVMQFSKDDGTTDAVKVQGSSAESRRASWREITK